MSLPEVRNDQLVYYRNLEKDIATASVSSVFTTLLIVLAGAACLLWKWTTLTLLPILVALVVGDILRSLKWDRWIAQYSASEAEELKLTPEGIQMGAAWIIASNQKPERLLPVDGLSVRILWAEIKEWKVVPYRVLGRASALPPVHEFTFGTEGVPMRILRDAALGTEVEFMLYLRARLKCPVEICQS